MLSDEKTLISIYDQFKDPEDGLLYLTYLLQPTLG